MNSLRNHFEGEVNSTRNISKAWQLRDSLHYNNERSVLFELFHTKLQNMYNIFEEEFELMEEDSKIRFLFKWVEYSDLQKSIEALNGVHLSCVVRGKHNLDANG